MEAWRLLIDGKLPGAENMRIDNYLLETIANEPPMLRFYDWEKPTISLGYAQGKKDIDLEKCKREGIDIAIRPTGGRAVLHWDEITYSVIIPPGNGFAQSSILESYQTISNALVLGLKILGIDAEISRGDKGQGKNPSCFSSISKYEVAVNGKKLIGSAQRRRNGAILQQGSIPIGPEFRRIVDFLIDKKIKINSTCVAECIYNIPDKMNIIEALKTGFEKTMGISFEIYDEQQRNSLTI